ncbi:MAG: hypothetical protein QOI89_3584 [Solirubrobacteraceae bacterium]|nr:hypothetical protein [Solirubrobacteraceae bacterium]
MGEACHRLAASGGAGLYPICYRGIGYKVAEGIGRRIFSTASYRWLPLRIKDLLLALRC